MERSSSEEAPKTGGVSKGRVLLLLKHDGNVVSRIDLDKVHLSPPKPYVRGSRKRPVSPSKIGDGPGPSRIRSEWEGSRKTSPGDLVSSRKTSGDTSPIDRNLFTEMEKLKSKTTTLPSGSINALSSSEDEHGFVLPIVGQLERPEVPGAAPHMDAAYDAVDNIVQPSPKDSGIDVDSPSRREDDIVPELPHHAGHMASPLSHPQMPSAGDCSHRLSAMTNMRLLDSGHSGSDESGDEISAKTIPRIFGSDENANQLNQVEDTAAASAPSVTKCLASCHRNDPTTSRSSSLGFAAKSDRLLPYSDINLICLNDAGDGLFGTEVPNGPSKVFSSQQGSHLDFVHKGASIDPLFSDAEVSDGDSMGVTIGKRHLELEDDFGVHAAFTDAATTNKTTLAELNCTPKPKGLAVEPCMDNSMSLSQDLSLSSGSTQPMADLVEVWDGAKLLADGCDSASLIGLNESPLKLSDRGQPVSWTGLSPFRPVGLPPLAGGLTPVRGELSSRRTASTPVHAATPDPVQMPPEARQVPAKKSFFDEFAKFVQKSSSQGDKKSGKRRMPGCGLSKSANSCRQVASRPASQNQGSVSSWDHTPSIACDISDAGEMEWTVDDDEEENELREYMGESFLSDCTKGEQRDCINGSFQDSSGNRSDNASARRSERISNIRMSRDVLLSTKVVKACPASKHFVTSTKKVVALRHKICNLLSALFPDLDYPARFNTSAPCVDLLLDQVVCAIKDSSPVNKLCVIPTSAGNTELRIVICKTPRSCIRHLRRKVCRLVEALLPELPHLDATFDRTSPQVEDLVQEIITSNVQQQQQQQQQH